MELNKEEFLHSELGIELRICIRLWDMFIGQEMDSEARIYQGKWEVLQLVLKQFFGIEYHFTRTDEYFGVCTEDETDWLIKEEKVSAR